MLRLPAASNGPAATWVEALFTSTSAVCVTGLVIVDTATHWSPFGLGVILVLVQVGGLGIMTLATVLGLLISRRRGLSSRLVAASSTRSVGLGDVRSVLVGVLRVIRPCVSASASTATLRVHPSSAESVTLPTVLVLMIRTRRSTKVDATASGGTQGPQVPEGPFPEPKFTRLPRSPLGASVYIVRYATPERVNVCAPRVFCICRMKMRTVGD